MLTRRALSEEINTNHLRGNWYRLLQAIASSGTQQGGCLFQSRHVVVDAMRSSTSIFGVRPK